MKPSDGRVPKSTSFTLVAPHYETLMAGVPYEMWLEYLMLIWTKLEAAPKRVLEVGCGTGKLSRMLAAKGVNVTGVDISEPMVSVARQLARGEGLAVEFVVQDAAELSLNDEFDAAFSFFDSLNNIIEPERFRSAISKIRSHLKSGAPFLFDLNTAFAFEHGMFNQSNLRPTEPIKYKWNSEWDAKTRLCVIHMTFWVDDGSFEETHVQRAYSECEILSAMKDAGFVRVQLFNAYTLDRPRQGSDRIHVLGIAP